MHNENEIRSIPCPACKVCGSSGVLIYQGLSDRSFPAPSLWNLKQCPDKECGLMWLDPMPLEEDIHKAYQSYYTHSDNAQKKSQNQNHIKKILTHLFRLFLRLTPIPKERIELHRMYLGDLKPGRLLEVGCGDGARLARLAALGWSVEGQEVDPVSADVAAKTGTKIHLGSLENLCLPEESYDAIVMNHVIEHVHDPVKLLMECRRLLKADGTLVAVTPNIRSYGHRIFKASWVGLDPPRHIILYSQESLHRIAQKVGFGNWSTCTIAVNADMFAFRSLLIIYEKHNHKKSKEVLYYFGAAIFLLRAMIVHLFNKDSGEECVLILRKHE